jgi:phospholipase/lecithinase/hemolysin
MAPSDALYVVFIGGNDVRDARSEFSPWAAREILVQAVAGVDNAVRSLIASGAQHILIVNAPNIGRIPETTIAADYFSIPWLPKVATLRSISYNFQLWLAMRKVEIETGVNLMQFNLFRAFNQLINNADDLAINNTTDPCYLTDGNNFAAVLNPVCTDTNGDPTPNEFFFIDEIHPTAKVHQAIGDKLTQRVQHYLQFNMAN